MIPVPENEAKIDIIELSHQQSARVVAETFELKVKDQMELDFHLIDKHKFEF